MNKFLIGCLVSSFVSVIYIPTKALGLTTAPQDGLVENVRFVPSGSYVTIKYNLLGPKNATYTVRLTLRRTTDDSYEYIPRDVSGDVGTGILPGKGPTNYLGDT